MSSPSVAVPALNHQKAEFFLDPAVTYLNCAYMSPNLKAVEAAGITAVRRKSQPWNVSKPDFFDPVRALKTAFAALINCTEPERIALIPSVSYGVATVAQNVPLRAGQNIVTVAEQFPSNYYTWHRWAERAGAHLRVAPLPNPGVDSRSAAFTHSILDRIDEQTAVVAIGTLHWADGTLYDLVQIGERCREVGAYFILDGTQSVGALPFDLARVQPDALICAGYKWLLGPYGLGVAYYGPRFDGGQPLEENWINRMHSDRFEALVDYQPDYRPMAARYSVGEQSNFVLVPMLLAAIRQIREWTVQSIQHYTKRISAGTVAQLRTWGAQIEPEPHRAGHLFGVRTGRAFRVEVLQEELAKQQIRVSTRGDSIRIGPHTYNDEVDFERLLSCFQRARN